MTESKLFRQVYGSLRSIQSNHLPEGVNIYNLSKHLEELYDRIELLENKLNNLK